jgi:hypothetical protein
MRRHYCTRFGGLMDAIIGYLSGHTCGDLCWHARDLVCHCSCGGKNHGIFARGGDQPIRTAKIDGKMYELAEVGPWREIDARKMAELRACNHYWLFDPLGPWVATSATKAQLTNWPELAAYPDGAKILWRQVVSP